MIVAARRRALFITNPRARGGGARSDPLIERLSEGGLDVVPASYAQRADVPADIIRRRDEIDCVVVAGGDGTVNAAASGLMATGLPLGILPFGTANDLARTLAIPVDVERAIGVITAGKVASIDVGSVNQLPFFNVASIGLSAQLAQTITQREKRRFGRLSYAVAAARVLATARPFSARITNQGVTTDARALQIAVGNGRYYGGGNVVEETARIDDGTLDLYALETTNVLRLALMLPAFRAGTHGAWQEVRTQRCVAFVVDTRRPRDVSVDGDVLTTTPAHFQVHPRAVRVYAPTGDGDDA